MGGQYICGRLLKMDTFSGMWLEGLTKVEAKLFIYWLPWLVIMWSTMLSIALAVAESILPSLAFAPFRLIEPCLCFAMSMTLFAYCGVALAREVVCLLRLVGICLLRCFCCCCGARRLGQRRRVTFRSLAAWLSLVPVFVQAAVMLIYSNVLVRPQRALPAVSDFSGLGVLHGPPIFQVASTLEFFLQVASLWVANRLRHKMDHAPHDPWPFTGGYKFLIAMWLCTFWRVRRWDADPGRCEHIMIVVGCTARCLLFLHCVSHAAGRCAQTCSSQLPLDDWRWLRDFPCTPGIRRAQYLFYHLLTRPLFLLVVHAPIGYPLKPLAMVACAARCGYVLLLSAVLWPVPIPDEDGPETMEVAAREHFSLEAALRLWDYAYGAYLGEASPVSVEVMGCDNSSLNGVYLRLDSMRLSGRHVYFKGPAFKDFPSRPGLRWEWSRRLSGSLQSAGWNCGHLGAVLQGWSRQANPAQAMQQPQSGAAGDFQGGFFLRYTTHGEWELSSSPTVEPGMRWAYVLDEAKSPDRIRGQWCEWREAELVPTDKLTVGLTDGSGVIPSFERFGSCARTDVHWLIAEEEGDLAAPAKLGLLAAGLSAEEGDDQLVEKPAEVCLVIAFRGTNSLSNLVTDARMWMRPLPLEQETATISIPMKEYQSMTLPAATASADLEAPVPRFLRSRWQRRQSQQSLVALDVALDLDEPDRDAKRSSASSSASQLAQVASRRSSVDFIGGDEVVLQVEAGGQHHGWWDLGWLLRAACACLCYVLKWLYLPPFPTHTGGSRSILEHDDEDEIHDCEADSWAHSACVHSGFSDAYSSVRADVRAIVQQRLEHHAAHGRVPRIYVTGHSLGGSLANLCALDMLSLTLPDGTTAQPSTSSSASPAEHCSEDGEQAACPDDASPGSRSLHPRPTVQPIVYTFGSPKPGNADFRDVYNALVPHTFRLVFLQDAVTSLPPRSTYHHVGCEVWLDDTGTATFAMSWAMQEILPARNSLYNHRLIEYFKHLDRAFKEKSGQQVLSVWRAL